MFGMAAAAALLEYRVGVDRLGVAEAGQGGQKRQKERKWQSPHGLCPIWICC